MTRNCGGWINILVNRAIPVIACERWMVSDWEDEGMRHLPSHRLEYEDVQLELLRCENSFPSVNIVFHTKSGDTGD